MLRWFDAEHGDRLLMVNLGRELPLAPPSEPLLAPPRGATWQLLWSSEDPRYGGHGVTLPSPNTVTAMAASGAKRGAAGRGVTP